MKKFVISLAAALALTALNAGAAELNAVSGGGGFTIEQSGEMSDMLIVTGYGTNGALEYASRVTAENGIFMFTLPSDYASVRAFDLGKETYDIDFVKATEKPEASDSPRATEIPASEASEANESLPTRKPLNPSYPEEIDQATAPAVVKKVMNSSGDGTDKYTVVALMQGREVEVPVEIDTVIVNAPSAYSELSGENASVLKKGDVVYFLTNIKGDKVRSIDLLYRPLNPFEHASSFASLYTGGSTAQKAVLGSSLPSERAYILGIITDAKNGVLTLYPATGSSDGATEIEYTKDTVTYIYDLSTRDDPYIAASSDISRSSVPKRAYDDNDDITFLADYTYNVAFVRTSDREAVDIVVYENVEY